MDQVCRKTVIKKVSLLYLSNIFFCFVACGIYLRPHFSVDGFDIWMDESMAFLRYLRDGRPVGYLLQLVGTILPFHPVRDSGVYVALFIAISGLFAGMMTRTIMKYFQYSHTKLVLVNSGVLLSLVNGFMNDWYGFSECMFPLYIPAISFSFLAVIVGSKSGIRNKALSFVFLLLAYNSYPVSIGFYVFYMLLVVWLQQKGRINRNSIAGVFVAMVNVVLTAASNLLLTKILFPDSARYAQLSVDNVVKNVHTVFDSFVKTLIDSNKQLPKYLFLTVALLLLGIACVALIKNAKRLGAIHNGIEQIATMLIVLLGGILCVYVPHLITEPVWITNRTVVALFSLFAVLATTIASTTHSEKINCVASVIIAFFMLFNIYSIQNAAQELFAANAIQQNMSLQIQAEIEDYESETGIEVKYVGFVDDLYPTWFYPFATQTYCEQIPNSYTVSWNRLDCLNYYTNKQYVEVTPSEEIRQQFAGKNWSVFEAAEQVAFEQDTVYICVY